MARMVPYLLVLGMGVVGGTGVAHWLKPMSAQGQSQFAAMANVEPASQQQANAAWQQASTQVAAAPAVQRVSMGTPSIVGTNTIADLVERVDAAVVNIDTVARSQNDPFFDPFGDQDPKGGQEEHGVGSGFVIDPGGLVVTNFHVVRGATDITVTTAEGKTFHGKVLGADQGNDLALVQVNSKGMPFLRFAPMQEHTRVGDWVVAIGSPLGLSHTVSVGIISAMNRGISLNERVNFIQTDAAINPGNSGGPLLNMAGEVVGVNTAIAAHGQGIGFAIPAWTAQNVISQLRTTGHVERTWLGVSIRGLTRDGGGVMVVGVARNGPAASAGLRPGDIIVGIDQNAVHADRDLLSYLNDKRSGAVVQLVVMRAAKKLTISATLQTAPQQLGRP